MNSTTDRFTTDEHGWAELLPAREPSPALAVDRRVPWTVVGAGLTGLACARRLAELHPGDQILLLEARRIAQGASGRNSGFVVASSQFPGPFDPHQAEHYRRINRINQAGLEILSAQVDELGIDCQWQREGFIHTAADRRALAEYRHFRHYLQTLEVEHRILSADQLRELLGTGHYRAGIRIGDGALVQPAALVYGLADSLPANVILHERSPVIEIEHGKPLILRLAGARVTTDRLILAVNYEAPGLGFLRRRLLGSTLAGSFTRRLSADELASLGSLREWGAISLHGGGATLRLTRDGRISIRNTAEYRGAALLTDAELARRQQIHRTAFERRFPQLAGVAFEYAWSGVEGITRNGTNFFGRQRENVFLAGGYNGSGVSRGTAFGTAIADYACGATTQTVSDCLASPRAASIPPRPLLDIGAFFKVRARFRGVGLDR